jgi:hypothetical protein
MQYNPTVRSRREWLRKAPRRWRGPSWRRLRRWRGALAVVAGLAALAGFVWLWWKGVPTLYQDSGAGPDARVQAVTGTRTALLVGLAGVAAVGALWLNNRTFRVTQLGHLTDRYAKAIEQLGSETIDVRLGGIYALEQLAIDSYRDQDQATIVEVLSAFIRLHSDPSCQWNASLPGTTPLPQSLVEQQADIPHLAKPPVDVQAALTVLGRLPDKGGSRADLTGAYLAYANLSDATLTFAEFAGADLTGARLSHAKLAGANLYRADLTDAHLICADLTGAWLQETNLTRANLTRVKLTAATLDDALLTDADLTDADLTDADLPDVDCTDDDRTGIKPALDAETLGAPEEVD